MSYRRLIGETIPGVLSIFVAGWLAIINAMDATAGPRASAPAQLQATTISKSEILLKWVDTNESERGYEIEAGEVGRGFSEIGETGPDGSRFIARNLQPNTTYFFRIKTLAKRNSRYSNTAWARTHAEPVSDVTPPSITILGPILSSASDSSLQRSSAENSSFVVSGVITLSADASDDTGVVRVDFYRDNDVLIESDRSEPFSATIDTTALPNGPHTIYAIAFDAAGNSSRSGVVTLTFDNPSPAAPSSLSATATSSSQISLSWVDNAINEGGFKLERSTSSSFSAVTTISLAANTTSYIDPGLAGSTHYYYRIKAVSANWGDSGYSAIVSAKTLDGLAAPAAPGTLVTTASSASQINLTWLDNANNEAGFQVERALTLSGPWSQVAVTGPNLTGYTDSGLNAETLYCYRVRAYNSVGNSEFSNVATTTTQSNESPHNAVLYRINAGGIAVVDYRGDEWFSSGWGYSTPAVVSVSGVLAAAPGSVYQSQRTGKFGYTVSNLMALKSYMVRLHFAELFWDSAGKRVFNVTINGVKMVSNMDVFARVGRFRALVHESSVAANGSGQIVIKFDGVRGDAICNGIEILGETGTQPPPSPPPVQVPAAPSGLSASAVSESRVNLSWQDNSGTESGFTIERAFALAGPWSQIGQVGANVRLFSSTGLNAVTLYYFRVRAFNAEGNSDYSNQAGTTTLAAASNPLPAANLGCSVLSSSSVHLIWEDQSNNETGFRVERATSSAGPWVTIATTSANTTQFTDSGLSLSTYFYRIVAFN